VFLIGDQVYADEPSDEIIARLRQSHTDADVNTEIHDFEGYTWLYHEAWTPPAVRWLLSTVPTGMLLDDHDLRDDWNTSLSWRREVTAQPWWHDRVIGGYGSYWVYQHLGNLSPEQLDADPVYARIVAITDDDARTRYLDDVAWRADVDTASIRWSYYRGLGGPGRRVRLVAIDSRCSRHLDPDDRRMVDAEEWAWVRDHVISRFGPSTTSCSPRRGRGSCCSASTTSRAGTRRCPKGRGDGPAGGPATPSRRGAAAGPGTR
jgi:hypothetical protein